MAAIPHSSWTGSSTLWFLPDLEKWREEFYQRVEEGSRGEIAKEANLSPPLSRPQGPTEAESDSESDVRVRNSDSDVRIGVRRIPSESRANVSFSFRPQLTVKAEMKGDVYAL